MKVIVCGGRNYSNFAEVCTRISQLPSDTVIIHGAAPGADSLADESARSLGLEVRSYPANWETYGRAAGPRRNKEMLKENPDLVLAFPGGRGTAHMIRIAEAAGIPVEKIK